MTPLYVIIASIFSTDINEMRCKNMVKMPVYFSFKLSLSLNASNFYDTIKHTFVEDLSWKDLDHLNCKQRAKLNF
jgi:hypothetical protein